MGSRDVRWAWLGSPTQRYAHAALGSRTHARSLHVWTATASGGREVTLRLPDDEVFEDRQLRLVDLDGDGRDEIIVVQANAREGAALVVLGLRGTSTSARLQELARGPYAGHMRWLNPVGSADFDGDGRQEIVSVTTPHIGGVLTLYRYEPPRLSVLATRSGVSNHRMGEVEQQLAAVIALPGQAPFVMVPGQLRSTLRFLSWDGDRTWREQRPSMPLPHPVRRLTSHTTGACVQLEDGRWSHLSY